MKTILLRGPRKNALSTPLLEDLLAQLDAAKGEALLVTGDGGAFSAGVDLTEVGHANREQLAHFLWLLDEVSLRLFHWERPTVALIRGHAIAGGAIIANTCDLRVCQADGRIRLGLTELKVGVPFPPKVLAQVRYRVREAERVVLEAGLYDPETALRLGLVDEVRHDAEAFALKNLRERAAIDPELYAEHKRAFRGGVTEVEAGEMGPRWATVQPRIRAFLQSLKR